MTRIFNVCLLVASLFIFGSCRFVMLKMIGIHEPKDSVDRRKIDWLVEKNGMAAFPNYMVKYSCRLLWRKAANSDDEEPRTLYYYLQPLQVFIYNSSDGLIYHQANCQTGGFPNLKWNGYHAFSGLKKKKHLPDTNLVFNKERFNYTVLKPSPIHPGRYKIVVVWTTFMGRQSRRLVDFSKTIPALNPDMEFDLIFVNFDPLFSKVID